MRRPLLLCLTALLLSGCAGSGLPYAREMGDTALMRTMGVDPGENGNVSVTLSTGRRARGLQGEEQEEALILQAQRPSLSGACLAVQGLSDSYVFYGYVDQLLLGEEQARGGILPVLRYFSQDVELGLGSNVWLIRGDTAANAVRSGGETGVEGRLSTLHTDGELGTASITRTAGDALTALLEDGAAYLPALVPSDGDQGALLDGGYGVVTPSGLSGWLDGEEARGLELLEGRELADVLEFDLPFGRTVVRVTGAETAVRPVYSGKILTGLEVVCRVQGELTEESVPLTGQEQAQAELALEERERERMEKAIDQFQRWGADPLRLGRRAALTWPPMGEVVSEEWGGRFSALTISVQVQGRINQR